MLPWQQQVKRRRIRTRYKYIIITKRNNCNISLEKKTTWCRDPMAEMENRRIFCYQITIANRWSSGQNDIKNQFTWQEMTRPREILKRGKLVWMMSKQKQDWRPIMFMLNSQCVFVSECNTRDESSNGGTFSYQQRAETAGCWLALRPRCGLLSYAIFTPLLTQRERITTKFKIKSDKQALL